MVAIAAATLGGNTVQDKHRREELDKLETAASARRVLALHLRIPKKQAGLLRYTSDRRLHSLYPERLAASLDSGLRPSTDVIGFHCVSHDS